MKRKLLSVILVLAMLMSSVALLASCVGQGGGENTDTSTEAPTNAPTDSEGTNSEESETDSKETDSKETDSKETDSNETNSSETGSNETDSNETDSNETDSNETDSIETDSKETDSETTEESGTDVPVIDDNYNNGDTVKGAGVSWGKDAFALTSGTIDESIAVTKTAEEMLALLADKDAMAKGEVYRVTEPLVLNSDTSYYGNLAAIIAEGGIVINNADSVAVKELIVKGSITVTNSSNITFFNVDVQSGSDGITLDEKSSNVSIKECRISAEGTALKSSAGLVSVLSCYMAADKGIVSTGDELAVQSSQIDARSLGISSSGADCIVKNNTITAETDGVGVSLSEGSVNGLVALNVIKDAQTSISVVKGLNCVVLLNSAVTVEGKDNTNLYVVKNNLGGLITLEANKYLLCDENVFNTDDKYHAVLSAGNTEYNGSNIQNINERVDYGANEEILPHTNKDLFIEMEKNANIRDISITKTYKFNDYIRTMAKTGQVVIVPPGAYSVSSNLILESAHSNTAIYAYGVYEEKDAVAEGAEKPASVGNMSLLLTVKGSNIRIHGLTMGYDFQSAGQAYVLEKWQSSGSRYVRVVSSAGYYKTFADSDTSLFKVGIQIIKGDETYAWANYIEHQYIQTDADGTIVFKITDMDVYQNIEPGDVFGCRLAGSNDHSIQIYGANNLLKDCVLYGYSAALAVYSGGASATGNRLERFHNTTKSSPVIDEATYNKYKALEKKYGMTSDGDDPVADGAQGLEVYIDEQGRYRGGLPRLGSVDALHVNHAAQGLTATSCIFENMVDDGVNQRSDAARIAGVVDNGDGTTTLYIKGSLALAYFNSYTNAGQTGASPSHCEPFRKGDTIFAYNSKGETLIEAKVLSASTNAGVLPDECHMVHVDSNGDCICDTETCKMPMHTDVKKSNGSAGYDCKCDKCGKPVHTDFNKYAVGIYDGTGNGVCENTSCSIKNLVDANGDGFNDRDGAYIITDMATAGMTTYNSATSTLSYGMFSTGASKAYIITFSTPITKVTVNTADVNFKAVENADFTDNDLFVKDKIICDNLSLTSKGFTLDNTLMQSYHSRGVLCKTTDATIKNCTIRNVALTGAYLSVEMTWGESTIAKNVTIEGCLFDNTGHTRGGESENSYAPIAIQGLGSISNPDKEISEDNLPCKNIKIKGNKFINTNTYYAIAIYDAQNIEITDNVIECRTTVNRNGDRVEDTKYGRAIYLERCINVDISGNTFVYGGGKVAQGTHIIAWDYKDLKGTDLYDANGNRFSSLPEEKGKKPTT